MQLISTATRYSGARPKDRFHVHFVSRPPKQRPSDGMTENGGDRLRHRGDDARGLLGPLHSELAVHARHHEVNAGKDLIRIVQYNGKLTG
jgi:hypothetical protein